MLISEGREGRVGKPSVATRQDQPQGRKHKVQRSHRAGQDGSWLRGKERASPLDGEERPREGLQAAEGRWGLEVVPAGERSGSTSGD